MQARFVLAGVAALLIAMAAFGVMGQTADASGTILIDASPDSATNLVGEDHTITAVVTDNGTPAADWDVTFDVIPPVGETSAPNEGDGGTDVTDANGEATFTYTGDGGPGVDAIEVCVLAIIPSDTSAAGAQQLDCEIVEKTWVEPTPTPTPEPEPSATPTATPAEAAPAAELPDTGSQPSSGDGFPWLGALALTLAGSALAAGGWAVSRRSS